MFCPEHSLQHGANGGVSVLSQLSEALPDQCEGLYLCIPCRGSGHCSEGVSGDDEGNVPQAVLAYEDGAALSSGAGVAAGDDNTEKKQNNVLP